MTFTDAIEEFWYTLSPGRRAGFVAIVLLAVLIVASMAVSNIRSWSSVRRFENDAIAARRDKEEALKRAAKIASEIKVREQELAKVEVKRDEKSNEAKRAADVVTSDRDAYERAVRERRPDVPGTDELCRELAALGYPCQPR